MTGNDCEQYKVKSTSNVFTSKPPTPTPPTPQVTNVNPFHSAGRRFRVTNYFGTSELNHPNINLSHNKVKGAQYMFY